MQTNDKLFFNTVNGIVQVNNKEPNVLNLTKGVHYEIFFAEENRYKGKYIGKHTFVREASVKDLALDNAKMLSTNIKEKPIDSLHYIEGALFECVYVKNESIYSEDKIMWGIFKILENSTNEVIDVSFVYDAFGYFNIDFEAVDKGDFATLKELLEKYFAKKVNRCNDFSQSAM